MGADGGTGEGKSAWPLRLWLSSAGRVPEKPGHVTPGASLRPRLQSHTPRSVRPSGTSGKPPLYPPRTTSPGSRQFVLPGALETLLVRTTRIIGGENITSTPRTTPQFPDKHFSTSFTAAGLLAGQHLRGRRGTPARHCQTHRSGVLLGPRTVRTRSPPSQRYHSRRDCVCQAASDSPVRCSLISL